MTIEAAETAIAEIVARADKLKADSPWRRSTHGFQIVSDARGMCDVSVCEIRTKGYTEAEQVALADYIEALQPRNARTIAEGFAAIKAERDDWKSSSAMCQRTAAEAARGLEALTDIDDAWDAFGTGGNRKTLTLAEQIASLDREKEASEAECERLRDALTRAREVFWADEAGNIAEAMFMIVNAALEGKAND